MTKIDVESPFGHYVDIIDLESGQKLLRVQWANDETGEYGQFVNGVLVVKQGKIKVHYDGPENKRAAFQKLHGE